MLYKYYLAFNYSSERWTFKNATITKVFKRKDPTLKQCLDTWVLSAKYANSQVGTIDKKERTNSSIIAKAVEKRVGPVYREAGLPLIMQMGSFCSYCEMYLPDKVEVEHVCPKSQYPLFCLAWENFLLSCGPCNGKATKDSRPSRATVVASYMNGNQPATEMGYYDTIRDEYLWPDDDDEAFIDLPPVLEYWSDSENKWKPLPGNRSVRLDQTWVSTDVSTRTVMADIYTAKKSKHTRKVRVVLEGANSQADNIVDLCKLNSPGNEETISDRRLIQRTEAWFAILTALNALKYVQPTGFDFVWASLLENAKSKGFYSVWVQILKLSKLQDPKGNLLANRFAAESNKAGLFPGTDTTNVPGS